MIVTDEPQDEAMAVLQELVEKVDTSLAESSAIKELREQVQKAIADRDQQVVEDPYPFVDSNEKGLRCFILDKFASGEYSIVRGGADEISFYAAVEQWIQTGEAPPKPQSKSKHLKSVPSE